MSCWASDEPAAAAAQADLVLLWMHPQGIVSFLTQHRDCFRPGAMVTDVCGIKGAVVRAAQGLPETVSFVGGHPMAGTEFSGIQNAIPNMFQGAHYILTPNGQSAPEHIALMERLARHIGCADVVQTTPEQHDSIIAYTSQMMHIIAVAVCDDPCLFDYQGFEGDSFRGCTRVAALDVPLWTQLFSLNGEALCAALEHLEGNLRTYRQAIQAGDREGLAEKLAYSSARKRSSRAAPGAGTGPPERRKPLPETRKPPWPAGQGGLRCVVKGEGEMGDVSSFGVRCYHTAQLRKNHDMVMNIL